MNRDAAIKKVSNIYGYIGIFLVVLSLGIFMIPTLPYLVYRVNPEETEKEIESISTEISKDVINTNTNDSKEFPPIDPSLPEQPYVRIPNIGVNSPIFYQQDYISALKKGSWMVPEFGTPMNGNTPIILAAHRFGYRNWTKEFRNMISYYNLPQTQEGDIIEIVWEQRLFRYEIYKGEESNYISDYDADLILYTCKFFNTPIRIFRYARLID